ncbi:MAG TPA: phosphoglucosamine mutase [Geminicoccaceae bacterium]|nr:phosphoglucosamine mutase [Geminicoccaceae bacterium]
MSKPAITRKLFGTDGIRGTANRPPMTAETALRLGLAAGGYFTRGEHRHRVVIGKDTRLSGYMLEPALTAGFVAMGMDVILLSPLPTPGVAMLTRSLRADIGVMISASHNPYQDNGIKLFGPDGYKLSDEIELAIEQRMLDGQEGLAAPELLGRAVRMDGARERYIEALKATLPKGMTLSGLRIVIDCAHGAAYSVAPKVLWELGAEVVEIGTKPNGFNINAECGSTAPEAMQAMVLEHGAHLGVALDGDADRLVLADERGELIDGDQILALLAGHWHAQGLLRGGAVVATAMSNLGLERHLEGRGLHLQRTQVGDRYVVEQMRRSGCNLGGEQSGHIVMTDFATTGDGLLAALQILAIMCRQERPLSELGRVFTPLPQRLRNCRLNGNRRPLELATVQACIDAAHARLGNRGRLLVRPSGTEPVIRVMVEADDDVLLNMVLEDVATAIERHA